MGQGRFERRIEDMGGQGGCERRIEVIVKMQKRRKKSEGCQSGCERRIEVIEQYEKIKLGGRFPVGGVKGGQGGGERKI